MNRRILSGGFAAANVIGIFFYLKNASLAWAIPHEVAAGLQPAIAGSAIVWGIGALPILLVLLVINGIWQYASSTHHWHKAPVVVAWTSICVAVVVDFWHH